MLVFVCFDLKRMLKIAVYIALSAAALVLIISLTQKNDSEDAFISASEYTLVIDAGHGGIDGGAVSASGIKESDINLAVALKTEAIAELLGISTVMTRSDGSDSSGNTPYSERGDLLYRAELADRTDNAVLISIHQNTFPSELVSGAEVMYAATDGSELLGNITQSALVACADPDNRRLARPAPKELLLTSSVHCPAILVECGFLSNPDEAAKLADNGYQMKLAAVFAASFLRFSQNMTV